MGSQHVAVVSGLAEERQTIFAVLVKRSYRIVSGKPLMREEEARPFQRGDVYHEPGNPETCTILYEDELAPYKPATDIVVIGQARAPRGQPVETMMIGIDVAGAQKLLRVTGDRIVHYRPGMVPIVTDPTPFTMMPVRYELAYGGIDAVSRPDKPFHYPRNPLGRGLAVLNVREAVEGLRLPNIEGPDDLLTPERIVLEDESTWNRQPLAQGLGCSRRPGIRDALSSARCPRTSRQTRPCVKKRWASCREVRSPWLDNSGYRASMCALTMARRSGSPSRMSHRQLCCGSPG